MVSRTQEHQLCCAYPDTKITQTETNFSFGKSEGPLASFLLAAVYPNRVLRMPGLTLVECFVMRGPLADTCHAVHFAASWRYQDLLNPFGDRPNKKP